MLQLNPISSHPVNKGIIEGDQIQVAAFSLEYFSYLTCSPWANENASPIVWFVFSQSAWFGALNACELIGRGWADWIPWANENASIKSAKAGWLIKNEPHYWACVLIGPGWSQSNMRNTQEKKAATWIWSPSIIPLQIHFAKLAVILLLFNILGNRRENEF